jgi:hypothetical protein
VQPEDRVHEVLAVEPEGAAHAPPQLLARVGIEIELVDRARVGLARGRIDLRPEMELHCILRPTGQGCGIERGLGNELLRALAQDQRGQPLAARLDVEEVGVDPGVQLVVEGEGGARDAGHDDEGGQRQAQPAMDLEPDGADGAHHASLRGGVFERSNVTVTFSGCVDAAHPV